VKSNYRSPRRVIHGLLALAASLVLASVSIPLAAQDGPGPGCNLFPAAFHWSRRKSLILRSSAIGDESEFGRSGSPSYLKARPEPDQVLRFYNVRNVICPEPEKGRLWK
jgi:hypothetical protein